MITHEIIGTGSSGNAVVINGNIMIDCGLSWKKIAPYVDGLKLVLLTHIHSDHFNRSTIRRLASERPTLRFVCGPWLVPDLLELGVRQTHIDIVTPCTRLCYPKPLVAIRGEELKHNVPNQGYHLTFNGRDRMFYATDTHDLDGVNAKDYDLYMIEANYTESEIQQKIADKKEAQSYSYEWDVLKNHMSYERAMDWLYMQMGPNSKYVLLHQHKERKDKNEEEVQD